MMHPKNRVTLFSALSLFSLVALTACGGSDDLSASSNSNNAPLSSGTSGARAGGSGSTGDSGATGLGSSACSAISVGVNADLNGFVPFPANNPWNTDISTVPAASNSATLISNYTAKAGNAALQADMGTQYGENWNVVDSSTQTLESIGITMYPTESDIMPVPVPSWAVIEGSTGGDRHLFVLDRNTCWLYESWGTTNSGGNFQAANIAVWDLTNTNQRPYNWTSADAAGLPVFPGLIRYDEVSRGEINHAIRFTLKSSADAYVAPATHSAGSDSNSFPMGTRFRLKSRFDISKYSAADQVILTAMKHYGLILADNGLDFELAGTMDSRWNDSDVSALKSVHFSDMEVITQGGAINKASPPTGAAPQIAAFNASSASVSSGDAVTLNWTTENDSWNFIDVVGGVRGTSVVVHPTATTTYTLNATNVYGRTKQSITVQVH